jgi:hypothetical protein
MRKNTQKNKTSCFFRQFYYIGAILGCLQQLVKAKTIITERIGASKPVRF